MTLEEKANEYALNALESEIDKVKNAYIDGYNVARNELLHESIDIDGVTYHDMSLPSGTLWSEIIKYSKDGSNYILEKPYNLVKEFSIPTKEDWEELEQNTRQTDFRDCFQYLSVQAQHERARPSSRILQTSIPENCRCRQFLHGKPLRVCL